MAVYGPRVNVHPDRYGADRSGQRPMVKWLILHTSEQSGAEDPTDAENLAAYMERPGDRPSSSGGMFGASYHGVTDTDRILPCTLDTRVSYSASGANQYGLHLCLPVRINPRSSTDADANNSRARWLDAGSRPYIRQAAEWIVDKARLYNIPLRRITMEQMRAGELGYCDHWTASKAFGLSDHTDVGVHFPWDVLAADINDIIKPPPPPEDDDMLELEEPERTYDSRESGGMLRVGDVRKIPVVYGHRAHVNVTCITTRGKGWVSVAGNPDAVGDTSIINFEPRSGEQTRSGSVPLGLPDGHLYIMTTVQCHVIVDVFAIGL